MTSDSPMGQSTQETASYLQERLPDVVSGAVKKAVDRVCGLSPLSGGASRDTWSFDARTTSGEVIPLILQRQRPGAIHTGLSIETEAQLLRTARGRGAPVAPLICADPTSRMLGAPFLLMGRIEGETVPQRILRQAEYSEARLRLAQQYGAALAQLHQIPLEEIPGIDVEEPLDHYRTIFDGIHSPHPALELGFRWLVLNKPVSRPHVLVHGDFRNGNGIVNRDGLVAVIDFEAAHVGDPLEDVGWFGIRAWRFGEVPQAGGFGSMKDFLGAYERAGGHRVDSESLRWWMVLGTVRWAVMCVMQGYTHLSGHRRSLELAAIGRRVCEPEFDLMLLLP